MVDGVSLHQMTTTHTPALPPATHNHGRLLRLTTTSSSAVNFTQALIRRIIENNLTDAPAVERTMALTYGFWPIVNFIFCLVLVVFTIGGNICVILAVHQSKALRAPQNKLIVSLAYADLFVGLVVMPFVAISDLVGSWILGAIPCDIFNVLDVCLCTSSILHLVVIALDRYFSITNMRYIQNRSDNIMYIAIAITWLLSAAIAIAPVIGWRDEEYDDRIANGVCLISQSISFQIFGTTFAFYLPLTGILILYGLIFRSTRSRVRKRMETTLQSTLHQIGKVDRDPASVYPSVPTTPTSEPSTPIEMTSTFHNGNWRTKLRFARGSLRKKYASPRLRRKASLNGSKPSIPARSRGNSNHNVPSDDDPNNQANIQLLRRPSNGTVLTVASGSSFRSKQQHSRHQTMVRREKKAATTLAIITLSFVACWLPFFIYAIVRPVCGDDCALPHIVESVFQWLGYINSTLNPVIYTIFSPDFRAAFKKMFRLQKR